MSLIDWFLNLFRAKPVALAIDEAWPAPVITLVDRRGRLTARDGVPVMVRSRTPGVSVAGKVIAHTHDGVARFAPLTMHGGTTMKISFDSPGLPSVTADVAIVPDPATVPAAITIVQGPPALAIDKALFPIKLQLVNAAGGNVAKAGVEVTPAPASGSPAGTVITHAAGKGPRYLSDAAGAWDFSVGVDDPAIP